MMEPVVRNRKDTHFNLFFVPIVYVLAAILIWHIRPAVFYPYLFGIGFGYVMQRSRFCMAACFRDIFLLRSTSLTRALLVAVALTTAGFMGAQAFLDYDLAALGRIYPVGVHTLLGGVLFGFGMVISGACVSGCLVRMGEGYLMQFATFAGLVAGSLLGAWNLNWWLEATVRQSPTVFLPAVLGWPFTVFLQFFMLLALFLLMSKIEGNRDIWSIFRKTSSAVPYGIGAVYLSALHFGLYLAWRRPWGVTSGITHAAGWLALQFGAPVQNWDYFESAYLAEQYPGTTLLSHPLIYLALAMVLGSLFASLLHQEFRLRRPRTVKYYIAGLIGGTFMGYGSRLAFGCNIGALLSGISSLSLHGWVFGFAALLGALAGGKALVRYVIT